MDNKDLQDKSGMSEKNVMEAEKQLVEMMEKEMNQMPNMEMIIEEKDCCDCNECGPNCVECVDCGCYKCFPSKNGLKMD
jgi:hypothetical protein